MSEIIETVVNNTTVVEVYGRPAAVEIYANKLSPVEIITNTGGGGGELAGLTVDTGTQYRVILFSNGTTRAIPYSTPAPVAPTGVTVNARLSSVRVSWTASPTAGATYAVYRDGVKVTTTSQLSYRDTNIASGSTYAYQVQTIDPYGQTSALTTAVNGFVDPATNSAPTISVTAWPTTAPSNGKTYLRVCARDVDAQTLALALSVDTGTVTPTDDPSLWIYTPGA